MMNRNRVLTLDQIVIEMPSATEDLGIHNIMEINDSGEIPEDHSKF